MWLDMEKLIINSGLQPQAIDIERPFVEWCHDDVFACDNVEGNKAGAERERQGRDPGVRSANRQDRMEQKNSSKRGVEEAADCMGRSTRKNSPKL